MWYILSIECWVEHIYFCVSVKYYVDIYYVHMMSLNSGISCLSFCLYGLSIGGHLNLNFLLLLGCVNLCHKAQYYDFFFMKLGVQEFGTYILRIMTCFCYFSLGQNELCFFTTSDWISFEGYFSRYWDCDICLFPGHTFHLFIHSNEIFILEVRWSLSRQHEHEFCFLIHSVTLCLFSG